MPDLYLLASWLFLLCALATGWLAGDRADRRVVEVIGAITLGSAIAYAFLNIQHALFANVILDAALLVLVTSYAMRGAKYWPVWFAGFHSVTVIFEICSLVLPSDAQMVVWRLGAFWFLPAYGSMVIGVLLDQRQRMSNASREA